MEIIDEKKKKKINIVTEVSIFSIVFGCVLGWLGYLLFGNQTSSTIIVRSNQFYGLALLFLSAHFLTSGFLLTLTKSKLAAFSVLLAGLFFGLFYLTYEIDRMGFLGAKIMSIVFYCFPVIIINRSWLAIKYISAKTAAATNADGQP